jgi:antagonist of KipI
MNLSVTRAGFLTSVQDLGRNGFRQFGVSLGGALDAHALRVANLLVGNDESDAGLEITLGGVRMRLEDKRVIAWCGGEFDVRVGSTPLPAGHSCLLDADDELTINQPKIGRRAWLTISGGIDVPLVLGSRSTDLRATFGGLNGRALRDGDGLPLGKQSEFSRSLVDLLREQRVASWSSPTEWSSTAKTETVLRVIRGVDWSRFNDVMIQRLTSDAFVVSPDSDRMGVRFDGPELRRNDDIDLVSEAVAPGTIQVPPSGRPILLLRDCQTIGGYPKIAQMITVDLSLAAQLRAGDHVRFSEVSMAKAHRLLLERERQLERFRIGLSLHDS